MTGKNLAAIALKVWGVVLLAGALTTIPQFMLFLDVGQSVGQSIPRTDLLLAAAGLGGRVLAGVLLLVLADRLARWSIPETGPLTIDANVADLTGVGFCVVGVVVLVWGLRDLALFIFALIMTPDWLASGASYASHGQRGAIAGAIAEVVAGVVLILGRNGLATGWARLRGGRAGAGPGRAMRPS